MFLSVNMFKQERARERRINAENVFVCVFLFVETVGFWVNNNTLYQELGGKGLRCTSN